MAKIQIPSPRNSYITRYSGSVSSEIATYEYSKIQERIKITNNGAGLLGVWVEGKSKKLQRGETCEFEGDITEFSVKSIGGKTEFYAKASQSSALRKIFEGEPVVAVNLESEEYILSGHKIIGESPNIRLGTSTSSYVCICPFKANTDYTIFFNRLPLTYYKIGYGTVKNISLGEDRITFDNIAKTYEIKYNTYIHKFKKAYDGFLYLYYSDNGFHGVEMFEGDHDTKPLVEPGVALNVYSRTQADNLIRENHYTVSKTGTEFLINTPKARYTFKKVTKADINIDTWRLYKGELIDENGIYHTMWQDADAEGAIKITGEDDFVSGFHGDEVVSSIKAFIDGAEVDIATNFSRRKFKNITFYVASTVYHCGLTTEAFSRYKVLSFEGDSAKVQNYYKALEALSVESARIALFQCYKNGSDDTQMFTHYSLNNNFMLYEVPTADNLASVPGFSKDITSAKLYTKYADIECKINRGQELTSYSGGMVNFDSTNRMKMYFDNIHTTTSVAASEVLASEFEWSIK